MTGRIAPHLVLRGVTSPAGTAMTYLMWLPHSAGEIPAGLLLVHNQVYPVARTPGVRGSRCWLQVPGDRLETCPCKWAPELGTHHRVAGVAARGSEW